MSSNKSGGFPKGFLWGAASSAHQVEGGNHNQWSVWELENAKSLAAKSPYQYSDLSNWDSIKKNAKSPRNYVSGRASEHYDRYEYDFDLLKMMNMNAWRFSVEWSRVEPQEGAWSIEAIEHYKTYIKELKKRNIEPMMTLFHFTLPVWFAAKGGFEKKSNVQYFIRFAEKMLQEFNGSVRYVITVNEPDVYANESYLNGNWPPMLQNRRTWYRVMKNLAYAHNQVAQIAHKSSRKYKVSIAKNSAYFYAGDDAKLTLRATSMMQYAHDDFFLRKVVKTCDFIGVNYYFSNRVYGYRVHNPNDKVSDLGWDLSPENIQHALERLNEKYNLPIIITENGIADDDDEQRKWWLTHTIIAMQKAMKNGVKLQGYLHWSLFDNFEWDKGYWPRFGLFSVEYKTMKRTPRKSAVWLAKYIKKFRGV